MDDDKYKIQRIYYLLEGMSDSIEPRDDINVDNNTVKTYNILLNDLMKCTGEPFEAYKFDDKDTPYGRYFLYRINPVINYLKHMHIETSEYQIEKIGALYKSLEDKELRKRCEDILLGDAAFDRAINQATQVLEDRIKKKANLSRTPLTGLSLVSRAIHKDLNETIIKLSDEPNVQEGYSNLFKGVIGIYRNPTHHSLTYNCSREYALKTCAFIDDLLKEIDKGQVVK